MAVQTFVRLGVNVRGYQTGCIWVNVYWPRARVYECTHDHGYSVALGARVISANASLMVTKYQIIVWCAPINGGPSTECYTCKQNQTRIDACDCKNSAPRLVFHHGLRNKICTRWLYALWRGKLEAVGNKERKKKRTRRNKK